MEADDLIACVLNAHDTLASEHDLSPRNPRVNRALGALVQGVMEGCGSAEVERVLDDPGIRAVRSGLLQRLALAEAEMERHWGEALCARAGVAAADFRDFIYWDCYRRLVADELSALPHDLRLGAGERVAFVGAGPLPLSAILMQARTGAGITCIDSDPQACALARELCRKAGLADIEIECASGEQCGYADCPVVFIASLVSDKAQVIERVRASCPGALVAIRSAERLSRLLYDPVDEGELAAIGCRLLGRTAHNPHVINTTLFYEARGVERAEPIPRAHAASG